jgi:hypothetical protein
MLVSDHLRRSATVILLTLTALWSSSGTALALGVYVSHCGVLKAFVAPTSTTLGSVTIGSVTYPVLIGGGPTSFGSSVCLIGGNLTPGALAGLTLSPLPAVFCGDVPGFRAPTATEAGAVVIGLAGHAPGYDPGLIIPVGTTLATPALGSRHCYATGLNGVGDAIVIAELTLPSPTATSASGQSSAPRTLPATSTDSMGDLLALLWTALCLGLVALIAARRRV